MRLHWRYATGMAATLVAMGGASASAIAQSGAIDGRVGRLESEMRAVQRRVFPGSAAGNGGVVQPEIDTTGPAADSPGSPSDSPVDDLTARVASLESQLRTLTGQVEQNEHRLQVLEDGFNTYRRSTDARLPAPEGSDPATSRPGSGTSSRGSGSSSSGTRGGGASAASDTAVTGGRSGSRSPSGGAIDPGSGGSRPSAAPAPVTNDPARQRLVAAVERPQNADPAETTYLYGYRLWSAHLYPEAEAQLQEVVRQYPTHRRASYAQNLLGRAYLDDNRPSLASFAFYDSYRRFPEGDRAPESLYYLAQALLQLNKPTDACRVYAELTDVYPQRIDTTMRANIAAGRTRAHCS